jgi:GTP-binding protein EngB required for normal cell division
MSLYPEARFITSAARAAQFITDQGREVAFAGRSNAGKSSAINAILNRRDFARTRDGPNSSTLLNTMPPAGRPAGLWLCAVEGNVTSGAAADDISTRDSLSG